MKKLFPLALLAAMVLLTGCRKNQVPNQAAVPSGRESGHPGELLAFTSSAADPDGDSVAIRFDWDDGDSSAWSAAVAGGTAVVDSHSWSSAYTYNVRAQARDKSGALSEWSYVHLVTITDNTPPEEPTLEEPRGFAVGDTVEMLAILSDPDGDSVAIRVSWGEGDTGDWGELGPSGTNIWLHHVWTDTGSRVLAAQARDKYGATSDWTEGRTVYVFRPKWRYPTAGKIQGCPAVAADGTVYFASDDGYLYAVTAGGSLAWRYHNAAQTSSSPSVAPDGTVYLGDDNWCLNAIDPNGNLKWRYATGDIVYSSPAIAADGTVYFGSFDGLLYAVNPDGTVKWRYDAAGDVMSSPAVGDDGTVYVGAGVYYSGYLAAIGPDGAQKWRYEIGNNVHSSPAIGADGTVYVGSDDGYLYAVDTSGILKWRCAIPGAGSPSPAVGTDGTIYLGSQNGKLYAVDANGALKWEYATGNYLLTCPALAADGTIYFGSQDYLYAISADTCKHRYWMGPGSHRTGPALAADGTVYFGSIDGCLYAIDGGSPLADAPWPKFRHDNMNTGRFGGGR